MKIDQIPIHVLRKSVKRISLRISYGPKVTLSVPIKCPQSKIDDFLRKKENWILYHYEKVKNYPLINLIAQDGQSVRIFGEEYIVRSIYSTKNSVQLINGEIVFYENGKKSRQKAFDNFQKQILKDKLDQMLAYWQDKMSLTHNGYSIRKQKSRWGWCNVQTKELGFNQYLVFQPLKAIESVVVHELAHLVYQGHGKTFYAFINKYMKDYKEHNKKLVMPI